MRDIRILRYAASHEEIQTVVNSSETWFQWRDAVRNSIGTVKNLGSWEVTHFPNTVQAGCCYCTAGGASSTTNATMCTSQDPIPLSGLDDGSIDPDLSPHAEVCRG